MNNGKKWLERKILTSSLYYTRYMRNDIFHTFTRRCWAMWGLLQFFIAHSLFNKILSLRRERKCAYAFTDCCFYHFMLFLILQARTLVLSFQKEYWAYLTSSRKEHTLFTHTPATEIKVNKISLQTVLFYNKEIAAGERQKSGQTGKQIGISMDSKCWGIFIHSTSLCYEYCN